MANRKVFFSFDYEPDVFRVSQVRQMGLIDDKPLLSSNDWEEVKRKGERAIQNWIDDNMRYRGCVIVLVGSNTANKKWVKYEIEKAWVDKKGLVGIFIHNLQCPRNGYAIKGSNPFDLFNIGERKLSDIVKCYDPVSISLQSIYDPSITKGQVVYKNISENIVDWVEEAIRIRNNFKK